MTEDWAGLAAEQPASLPGFPRPIPIFLGPEEWDDDEQLTTSQLDHYAATWQDFLAQAPALIEELKRRAFARYQQLYAPFYDDPAQSGAAPLGLTTAEQHFAYLQDVACLRLSEARTLRFVIHYGLDSEHGLEVKFVANTLADIGGIAET